MRKLKLPICEHKTHFPACSYKIEASGFDTLLCGAPCYRDGPICEYRVLQKYIKE